ncbi:MAG: hypothetical protein WB439_11310 [Acidobacteriaceae bacterium]
MTLSLVVGLGIAGVIGAPNAMAQDSSSQSPASQSSSQSSSQTTAAPGTVAVTKATAAALAPYTGPKYDNRWEVYGGLAFMNGQAGQNQPGKRYNMGGAEAMGTYWLTGKLGLAADYRFGAGTTPVISTFYNRVVVMQNIFSGGLQYRGPKNRYAAVDLHVLGGATDGDFNYAVTHYPGGSPVSACAAQQGEGQVGNLGLYCNHIAPWGAVGGSIDFNESGKLAIRVQPDLTFEHFGTETREYVGVSMGVVYRLGHR